jgi:hypothetical protein
MGGRTWAEIKVQRSNTTDSCVLPIDQATIDQIAQLNYQLGLLKQRADRGHGDDDLDQLNEQLEALARRVVELEDIARESEETFTFRALGQGRYNKLKAQYPPTKEQKADPNNRADFDPAGFAPALMAATCIAPAGLLAEFDDKGQLDHEVLAEWQDIYQDWDPGAVKRLWGTCAAAHQAVNAPPKSVLASEILGRPPTPQT